MSSFRRLGLNPNLVNVLQSIGIFEPTPVQEKAIPALLQGRDIIAQSQTGTGKTLAFSIPVVEKVKVKDPFVQALIIVPTRELAIQITAEIKKVSIHNQSINVIAVYGGQDVIAQIHQLNHNPHVIIATPGRLLDHLRRGTISIDKVKMLILDEADQMLHMGFLADVEQIIEKTPVNRQTILCSATMPNEIKKLASSYMNDPLDVQVQKRHITLDNIKQRVVETTDRAKLNTLIKIIETYRPYMSIVFCRTKRRVKKLNETLLDKGFDSGELHGDLSQAKREEVLENFRQTKIRILIATDVAARGLDVEGVSTVFNYDIPQDFDSYIHRIGRTGRAGEKGLAITLVTPKDRKQLIAIEKSIKRSIERRVIDHNDQNNNDQNNNKQNNKSNSNKAMVVSKIKTRRHKKRG